MIAINASLIYTSIRSLKLISMMALAANSILSYLLIYSMVSSHREIRNLENIVYIDYLTKLSNRARLFLDVPKLIAAKTAFRLLFIDLNHFKQINDQYGHTMGDRYLICFAKDIRGLLGKGEGFYRMSGDEFVIISREGGCEDFTRRLTSFHPAVLDGMEIPFLGLSIGWADYPSEESTLDKLIGLADRRMYRNKPQHSR